MALSLSIENNAIHFTFNLTWLRCCNRQWETFGRQELYFASSRKFSPLYYPCKCRGRSLNVQKISFMYKACIVVVVIKTVSVAHLKIYSFDIILTTSSNNKWKYAQCKEHYTPECYIWFSRHSLNFLGLVEFNLRRIKKCWKLTFSLISMNYAFEIKENLQ